MQGWAICITKWVTFITRWDNNCKVLLYRKQIERNWGNWLWQPTLSFKLNLSGDKHFRSWNSIVIKRKKKSHTHQRRICVTCKLEKQLLRVVSCIENFCKISRKLSITESDNSNSARASLLKSLSAVDILFPTLQKFRNTVDSR